MSVALLVITDRPEYLERSSLSAAASLPAFDQYIFVEDNEHELGFAGAIAHGWAQCDCDFLFHLEDDFTFNRPVPVDDMIAALDAHPHLVQMALLRQPWNASECAAGGVIHLNPDDYVAVTDGEGAWLEHKRFVTTNPAVWPRWVVDRGWPACENSEGMFAADLFAGDPALRAAYWGRGEEWVEHIGLERAGHGY